MNLKAGLSILRAGMMSILLASCLGANVVLADETNSGSPGALGAGTDTASQTQDALRSYLQIQEELHNTQIALEKNRQEAEASAARNAEMVETRLKQIEESVSARRMEELKDLQRSNHIALIAAGIFALIAFLVLLFTAFLQYTAVNRLATVAAALPTPRALSAGKTPAALGMGETEVIQGEPVEHSSDQFLGAMDRLEKRVQEMEQSLKARLALAESVSALNGEESGMAAANLGDKAVSSELSQAATVNLLLGKGHTLLKLEQVQDAIACYDEVLSIDERNAEALVKKGMALEKLQKLDEAIACYDRALEADGSMTMAYLYKGGVYNRMERYSEALECYEKALQSQEKSHAA